MSEESRRSMQEPPAPEPRARAYGAPYAVEPADEEISLLDVGVVLAQHRRLIAITAVVLTVLGLLVAVVSSSEYTASARVIREAGAQGDLPGIGALSALRGFGLSLGAGATGLSPEAYPDILRSREVLLAVARDTFYFDALDRSATFVTYVEETKGIMGVIASYTIGLPGRLLQWARDDAGGGGPRAGGDIQALTKAESDALRALSDLVSTSEDVETGLMTITVTTRDPLLSAELAQQFVQQLRERVRTVRTQKARENLAFIETQFEDAERELRAAEEALAEFDDRNNNPQSARLRTERDRLQRQVTFASQLYSDLQTQRTQAQIELQRSEPVVTVLEQPAVPLDPSGPNRKLIVLLSLILGMAVGIGLAFVKAAIERQSADEAEHRKLEEIKAAFLPKRWRNGHNGAADSREAEPEASAETSNPS